MKLGVVINNKIRYERIWLGLTRIKICLVLPMNTALRPFFLWVIFWLSLTAAGQVNKPLVPAATIPFEWYHGHIYLNVSLDSLGEHTFLFDTGTPGSFLYRDHAVALDLPIKLQKRQLHERDSLDHGHIKRLTFHLNGIQLPVRKVKVYRRTHFPMMEGKTFVGAIGTDLTDAFIVEIDYHNRVLRLYDRETYEVQPDYFTVKIKTYKGTPILPVQLREGNRFWEHRMLLQTGHHGTIAIAERTARKFEMYEPYEAYWYGYDITLPGHYYPVRQVTMEEVGMIGIKWADVPVTLVRRKQSLIFRPYWADGVIGNSLLKGFTWVLDTKGKQLHVKANDPQFVPQRILSWSGLLLKTDRQLDRLFVYEVLPNSPAEKAGIQKGDEIISIYDQPFSTLSLDEASQLMSGSAKLLQLYIKQGKTIYDKIFRLEPMTAPKATN